MEKRVIVEDCEEEEDDDNFPGFAEYGAFSDTTMGELKMRQQKISILMILISC